MSKVLTSPVKHWPGTITIPDYLTMEQAITYEEALDNASALIPEFEETTDEETIKQNQLKRLEVVFGKKYQRELLPGIFACVEQWNLQGLENISIENFPATPKQARSELVAWLIESITDLYKDETEIPNA